MLMLNIYNRTLHIWVLLYLIYVGSFIFRLISSITNIGKWSEIDVSIIPAEIVLESDFTKILSINVLVLFVILVGRVIFGINRCSSIMSNNLAVDKLVFNCNKFL